MPDLNGRNMVEIWYKKKGNIENIINTDSLHSLIKSA
jgi:hypothetical protein